MMSRFFERLLPSGPTTLRRAAAALVLGVASAPVWLQADELLLLHRQGVVSDFASLGDLQPATPVDTTPLSAVRPAVTVVPTLPVEAFAHLKSAVPLLVGDIDVPRSVALVRPMVGRSVGVVSQRDGTRSVSAR